jgi:hypothetical protein
MTGTMKMAGIFAVLALISTSMAQDAAPAAAAAAAAAPKFKDYAAFQESSGQNLRSERCWQSPSRSGRRKGVRDNRFENLDFRAARFLPFVTRKRIKCIDLIL